ncbi:hypothetical protein JCM5296_004372 [Sporobolomyces johnsonii]
MPVSSTPWSTEPTENTLPPAAASARKVLTASPVIPQHHSPPTPDQPRLSQPNPTTGSSARPPQASSSKTGTGRGAQGAGPARTSKRTPAHSEEGESGLAGRLFQELSALGLAPGEQYSTIADRGDFELAEHGSMAATLALSQTPQFPQSGSTAEWWEYGTDDAPNLHLTPEGDIPVGDVGDTPFSFAPFAERDPIIRLSSAYAHSISRHTRIFHLAPEFPAPSSTPINLEHLQQRALVLYSSCTKDSMGNFGTAVCKFLEFCDAQHTVVPPAKRLPAGPDLVEAFLCSFAGKVTADTVRKYYNGIRTWHAIYGFDVVLPEAIARRCFKGIQRLEKVPDDERPPASWKDLLAIRAALDLDNGSDACFWAAVTTAFFGMSRPGAVTLENLTCGRATAVAQHSLVADEEVDQEVYCLGRSVSVSVRNKN